MKNRIYLDYAATTPVDPEVLEVMTAALRENYGNASSIHTSGRTAHRAVDQARRQVAASVGASPEEIFFTSGGSESNNWALKGIAMSLREKGRHVITSAIEHHSVLHTCDWLEKQGFEISRLPVDACGRISPESVLGAIRPDTILISIMMANNEIGTLEPVTEIGQIAREKGILFHTDAVQAFGAIPIDTGKSPLDLMSLSAHKIYGPKGVGALYVRKGVRPEALVHGGAQERGRRAGTENTAGIVGFGKAAEIAAARMEADSSRIRKMRDLLIRGILTEIPGSRLNGDPVRRLPNNASFSFEDIDGEALLLRLDLIGIEGSAGSACTSGSLDPSHVLKAIGLSREQALGSLRLTLGRETGENDIQEVIRRIAPIVTDLRAMRTVS